MDDLLFQTTVMIARRLLKSRLRLYLCRLKNEEEPVWGSIITYEEGVEQEALAAWLNVRACWASSSICRTLLDIASKLAFRQARADIFSFFVHQDVDPRWISRKLHDFRPTLG